MSTTDSLTVNGYNLKQVETCWKYGNGFYLNPESKPYDWTMDAYIYGAGGNFWKNAKPYFKGANLPKGQSLMDTYRHHKLNVLNQSLPQAPKAPTSTLKGKALIKYNNAQQVATEYSQAKQIIKSSKTKTGKALKQYVKAAEQGVAEAKVGVHVAEKAGTIKPVGVTGKIGKGLSKISGKTTVKGKYLKLVANNSKLRTVSNFCKGKGALVAVDGLIELGTNVLPAYQQLGTAAGNKQLTKSTIKVGASVAGFAAGTWAGGIAGAKVGAIIGAWGGPVVAAAGAVVGATIGALGGWLGATAASKAAEAATGPSELDKAAENQARLEAKKAVFDSAYMNQILVESGERLKVEQQYGKSADYDKAIEALKATGANYLTQTNQVIIDTEKN